MPFAQDEKRLVFFDSPRDVDTRRLDSARFATCGACRPRFRPWSTACLACALVSVLWAPRCVRVCPSPFLCLIPPPPLPSLLWMWCTADLMSTTRRAFTTHSGWVCVTESGEEMWGKRVRHVEASLCGGGRRGRCSCALFAFAADFWTPAARCVAGWVRRLPSQSHTH